MDAQGDRGIFFSMVSKDLHQACHQFFGIDREISKLFTDPRGLRVVGISHCLVCQEVDAGSNVTANGGIRKVREKESALRVQAEEVKRVVLGCSFREEEFLCVVWRAFAKALQHDSTP